MEPQEQRLRNRIQAVIDGTEPASLFAAWFEGITWLIRSKISYGKYKHGVEWELPFGPRPVGHRTPPVSVY